MDREEVDRVIEKFTEIERKKKVLAEKIVSRLEPTPEED
jgi:diaminopimelate decarboxylase